MSLARAIDAAIAFAVDYLARVEAYQDANPGRKWNDPIPDSYPRFDEEQFEQLGRTIRIEAEKFGLGERLPQPDSSLFNPKAEPSFLGQVNLPGWFHIGTGFYPMPTARWRDAMLTLRALGEQAEAMQAEAAKNGTPPAEDEAKGQPGRRGFPLEALAYARKLRAENPMMKAHSLRLECLKHFSEVELPPDGDSFRRWLNRKRANRAN